MFVCLDCDYLFEEPGMYNTNDDCDYSSYETCNGCPNCGGAYIETFRCGQCGEWIVGDYAELDDGTPICAECY